MPPILSFIIPAFNAERTIDDTVQSVLAQTRAEIELLVVDDGSTDSTFSRLSAITDPRVRIARRPNRGVAASRNLGLILARGEFVCFLDADDVVVPHFAIKSLGAIGGNDAVSTAYLDTDAGLKPALKGWYPALNELCLDRLRRNNPLSIGATIFRADTLHEVTRYFGDAFPSGSHVEDWELLLRFTSLGGRWAAPIEEPLMLCRLLPVSRSAQAVRVWEDGLLLLDRWVPHLERAIARRHWTISHLARALANQQQEFAARLLENVAPIGTTDIPVFTGTLRVWADRYGTVSGEHLRLDALKTRLNPLGLNVASQLAAAVALPSWTEAAHRALQFVGQNQRLVVYGFGRNGREACRALSQTGINFAIIDDAPGFSHPLAISTSQLNRSDVVLVTPDADAEILHSLRRQPVQILTRNGLFSHSQTAA